MQNVNGEHTGRFAVHCSACRQRRQYIATRGDGAFRGVLVCPGRCDGVPSTELVDVPAKIDNFYP